MNPKQPLLNLLDLDREQLKAFFADIGEKGFRVQQLMKWIYHFGIIDFNSMSNFSKKLRENLAKSAVIKTPEFLLEKKSSDGTHKWVVKLADGNSVETVYIPEKSRGTLCVSSQVGCALNCSFCSTGKQGFNRNLTTAEIIGQVCLAQQRLRNTLDIERPITNVVMMGMGEPCLNLDAVIPAMNLMLDDFAFGLSKRRVTLSTSGVIPAMLELREKSDVALAVSLHAPNDKLRDELVPINKKYPLEQLMGVCQKYFAKQTRRVITFEYVMLDGINDQPQHAKQLITLLNDVPGKINLIPFNPFPQTDYTCSPMERIYQFRDRLMGAGINTTIRKTRGDDIDAACGQLVGDVFDRTSRTRLIKQKREMAEN